MKNNYYDEKYFLYQKRFGDFGGQANAFKFERFVNENDTVLDFGCGGGDLISGLGCKRRIGIELNDIASKQAAEKGVEIFKYTKDIPDNICDLIISHHALKHTLNPYEEIKALYPKLKENGKIVFVVPNEKKKKWDPADVNKHLYTWSEINIGNLFDAAGYNIVSVKEIYNRWPPKFITLYKIFGKKMFYYICNVYGMLRNNLSQIQIVATKK